MKSYPPKAIEHSLRLYRQLLVVYPRTYREEYALAMAQLFRDQCRDAWREWGGFGLAGLWIRSIPDLIKTAVLEHLTQTKEKKRMTASLAALREKSPKSAFFLAAAMAFVLLYSLTIVFTFWLLPEKYGSVARVEWKPKPLQPGFMRDPFEICEQLATIKAGVVLDKVVSDLNLARVFAKQRGDEKELTALEARELLNARMRAAAARNSSLLEIWVYDADKFEAALIANKVAEVYGSLSQAKGYEVRLIDPAKPGLSPVTPNKPMNLVVGGFVGLVAAAMIGLIAAGVTATVSRKSAGVSQ